MSNYDRFRRYMYIQFEQMLTPKPSFDYISAKLNKHTFPIPSWNIYSIWRNNYLMDDIKYENEKEEQGRENIKDVDYVSSSHLTKEKRRNSKFNPVI